LIKTNTKPVILKTAVQALGSDELTPPNLAPTTRGSLVLKGVNYASGGSGILNSTGKLFVSTFLKEYYNSEHFICSYGYKQRIITGRPDKCGCTTRQLCNHETRHHFLDR